MGLNQEDGLHGQFTRALQSASIVGTLVLQSSRSMDGL